MTNQNNHRPTLNKRIVVDSGLAKKLAKFKKECGAGDFDRNVEKKFGIKRRKARYVLQIADKLKKSEIAWEKVEHLGWTKLKELAPILKKQNVDDILDKLKDANIDTVKKFKRRYDQDGKLIVSPVKTLLLTLTPAQHKAIDGTLKQIKKDMKLDSNGDALAALCKQPVVGAVEEKDLALSIALHCVRNTAIERIHEGSAPVSKRGDYSDVKVVTPSGETPWNEVSRITQDEMQELMQEVANKIYTVLLRQNDPAFVERMKKRTKQSTYKWDAPHYLTDWFTGKWDNKTK